MINDDYFTNYLLSFFSLDRELRLPQVLHVLRGKRTPSMYYLTEINKWHHGFSLAKNMQTEKVEQVFDGLLESNLISRSGDGYMLTAAGQEALTRYFSGHYFPARIQSFANINLRRPFWERMQLYTQVFSEFSYKNSQYIPIVKHPLHQENVRQLFQAAGDNREAVFSQWKNEQYFLFERMPEKEANTVANFLTGHNVIGMTRKQMADFHQMTDTEFHFYLMDTMELMIETIKQLKENLPLIHEILQQLNRETNFGLAASTFQTYLLLRNGKSIEEISIQRNIKPNTVKEHLLEIAFTLDDFDYNAFIPAGIYMGLKSDFSKQANLSYKEARERWEELEFYQYRLVELERLRENEATN